jgi:cytochrome c-type biogenesis protein
MGFSAGVAFAFVAGIVAFLSPCSFPLLPAYVSYYLGLKEPSAKGRAGPLLKRGILGGMACAGGAISTLVAIGIGVSAVGGATASHITAMELTAGAILVLMGALMFLGKGPTFHIKAKAGTRMGYAGLFGFGAIYALATAGCVAPLFIGVVAVAVSSGFPGGVVIFSSYALGLGVLLVVVTLLVASAKEMIMARLMRSMKYITRTGGLILIGTGVYLFLAS